MRKLPTLSQVYKKKYFRCLQMVLKILEHNTLFKESVSTNSRYTLDCL